MSRHTPGPWVQFADQGKCVAIMPAGRDGDICTFKQSPTDDDARLMTAAPELVKALEELQSAETTYRMCHGLDGDGHINTGRAWDKLRQAGQRARAALSQVTRPVGHKQDGDQRS
jgi:hypothetical protein